LYRQEKKPTSKISLEEARSGAVSPGSGWSISTFRADFARFTSKSVLISPNLLKMASSLFESEQYENLLCGL
jgi:hypothetical protein